jgi:hypothetical protein
MFSTCRDIELVIINESTLVMKLYQMTNMFISLNTTANVLDMIKHGLRV